MGQLVNIKLAIDKAHTQYHKGPLPVDYYLVTGENEYRLFFLPSPQKKITVI